MAENRSGDRRVSDAGCGGGVITLDNAAHPADQIVGVSDAEEYSTLYNVDNTIEGAGNIGTRDGNLSLVNERCGAIDANLCGQTLTLDTGNSIANWGILEATNGGKLLVQDCVNSCGPGHALIKDLAMIEFDAAANINVTFDNGSGYGELILVLTGRRSLGKFRILGAAKRMRPIRTKSSY